MKILIIFIFAILLAGCVKQNTWKPIEYQNVSSGNAESAKQEIALEINSEKEWEDVWKGVFKTDSIEVPLPSIDFAKETVFAVFLGEKNTGGYSASITKIYESDNQVEVKISATKPGPGSMVTESFTYPYIIVKTKKINKPASFSWNWT
ncbi:MAG: protease complex subunit PrcB family protein [Nanoarchaeota archaeon]|nr:MAG: protease complex subunit PrcB family protein [Nanoarchaeota archaeon]